MLSASSASPSTVGNPAYISFSEMWGIAVALGVRPTIACGVVEKTHKLRLGLTTADGDPMLTLRADDKNPERWLTEREQSAPERWDYEAEITCFRERFFVELEHGGRRVALAFAPVALAVLTAHGWVDDASRTAEAVVGREDLLRCLHLLGAHPQSAIDE